jgi:hypothetical protein
MAKARTRTIKAGAEPTSGARVGTPRTGTPGRPEEGRKARGGKNAQPPQPKRLRFTLPESGEDVRITVTQGTAVLHRKITVDGRHVRAKARPAKPGEAAPAGKRPYLTHPVEVPALFVELRRPDRPAVKVRACCKPPDQFVRRTGLEMASRRLLPALEGLGHKDRSFIRWQLCGGPPAKRLATAGEAAGAAAGTLPAPEAEAGLASAAASAALGAGVAGTAVPVGTTAT